jgi:hypothetical protein
MVGGEEIHLNRRRLIHMQRSHTVKIGLYNATAIDGDGLAQRRAQPVECRTLHLPVASS